jgi:hypothetical protein
MGSGVNDEGAELVFDCDAGTGLVSEKYRIYWHLGATKVTSSDSDANTFRPLAMAAVYGTDAGLDAEGLALYPTHYQVQVLDRISIPLPTGETISCREALRRSLRALAKRIPPPG